MKKNSLLRKEIEKYLQIPFAMIILLLIMNGVVYGLDVTSGIVVTVFVLLYWGTISIIYFKRKPNIMSDLVAFTFAHGSVQNELIKELTVPYILVNLKGRILWSNQAFCDVVKSDMQHMRKHINTYLQILHWNCFRCNRRTIIREWFTFSKMTGIIAWRFEEWMFRR